MVDVLGLTLILPLLHIYAVRFNASALEIGVVVAAFPAAQLIGLPVMGALSDRYGRKPLLIISQISTCIGFLMLAFAGSLWMVILSRLVDGLFGANLSTAQAALSDITTEEQRTQALGITGAAFGIGFIFGPVISLLMLEFSDELALPALAAAGYSMLSIVLTQLMFRETLPASKRSSAASSTIARSNVLSMLRYLSNPLLIVPLTLLFAQQLIFFGFESLLGVFTLNRLGLLAQGNAFVFIYVGIILVLVQVRFLGKWSRKYGEAKLVRLALALLAIGLLLLSATPQQANPLYERRVAEQRLLDKFPSSAEAIVGRFAISLPPQEGKGFGGFLWLMLALTPLSVGAALIRPSLNSMITKRVDSQQYGRALGIGTSFTGAADAVAPLIAGLIFQQSGAAAPFLVGGVVMFILFLFSLLVFKIKLTDPTLPAMSVS
ncbi:MAG: MFS transporter [Anaerolineae bacterium]